MATLSHYTNTIVNNTSERLRSENPTSLNEGLQATLSRQYAVLKDEVKQIFYKLERIESLLDNLVSSTGRGIISHDSERSFLGQLPLTSVAQIENFDAIISKSSEKFNLLAQLLYLIGGDSNKKIVCNILNKLITSEAARFYSGEGRKHKLSFRKLKLYDAVTAAARKKRASVTYAKIKQIVSLFLATEPLRMKKI